MRLNRKRAAQTALKFAAFGVFSLLELLAAGCERPKPTCAVLNFDGGMLDESQPPNDARPLTALVYSRTTGWRHDSIPAGRTAIAGALTAAGYTVTQSEDLAVITDAQLAGFSAVVLLSITGEPFGADDGPQMRAVLNYVQQGGGIVGVHSVTDEYPCGILPSLIGGTFRAHPGDVRRSLCTVVEAHPSTLAFGTTFTVTDEIHIFWNFHPENHVTIRCTANDGVEQVPIAWWRQMGRGRLVVNALGHGPERYADPVFLQAIVDSTRWSSGR